MIELLAQLAQPPAIVAQLPNYRTDINQSCPGFDSNDNEQISRAAISDLMARYPELRSVASGSIRIWFTSEFNDPYSDEQRDRIDRFLEFSRTQTEDHKYVFFCPHVMDTFTTSGFLGQAIDYIEIHLGISITGEDDLIRQLGLSKVGEHNRGTLYYVRPRT